MRMFFLIFTNTDILTDNQYQTLFLSTPVSKLVYLQVSTQKASTLKKN